MDFKPVILEVLNKEEAAREAEEIEEDMVSRRYDPFYYELISQRRENTPEELFEGLEEQPLELELRATLEGAPREDRDYGDEAREFYEQVVEEWRSGDLETNPPSERQQIDLEVNVSHSQIHTGVLKTGADALHNAGYELLGYETVLDFSGSEIEDIYRWMEEYGVPAGIRAHHPDILFDVYYNGEFNISIWGTPEDGTAPPPELDDRHRRNMANALRDAGLPVNSD